MARTLEIPAVVGLNDITSSVRTGDVVIVDGIEGTAIINPDSETLASYEKKIENLEAEKKRLRQLINAETIAKTGKHIIVAGNIGSPKDVNKVLENGGEGVGLFRTEFLYMDRDNLPSEDEQFEAYKYVAEKMGYKGVVIRTLDIGGDKKLSYLPMPDEANPFLGYRAIRLCLDRKDIFKTQLRALLRASVYGNLHIMFPMISSLNEFFDARGILKECMGELEASGIPFNKEMPVGIMVEIPSAAVMADEFAKHVDFFSIGTNDLCQYTLAVDRMNEKVSRLYQPFHPGILRLIRNVIDASHRHGKFTGMCGEMAGAAEAAVILLGLGLDEFSMSPVSINAIKKIIRGISYEEAKKIAEQALALETPEEVLEYSQNALKQLNMEFV
jgi:phosphotransferase system enzyme I (PtsI)